ncbi:hypothetical protein [Methylocystis sp. S23]
MCVKTGDRILVNDVAGAKAGEEVGGARLLLRSKPGFFSHAAFRSSPERSAGVPTRRARQCLSDCRSIEAQLASI